MCVCGVWGGGGDEGNKLGTKKLIPIPGSERSMRSCILTPSQQREL